MITLKIKTKSGFTQELQFEELLEVDGRPYQPADSESVLLERLAHLEGRVSAIETIFTRVEETTDPTAENAKDAEIPS